MDTRGIEQAVKVLKSGGVIAYPTESIWGLGCDPFNQQAVSKVLNLKNRHAEKGLILVAASLEQFPELLEGLSQDQWFSLRKSCPGPITWLIPDAGQIFPDWIRGKFETVAIRVSTHPVVKQLCESFGGLMVSTSANPEGLIPAKTESKVAEYFPHHLDYILAGSLGTQDRPSVIKDLVSSQIIRS